jgi:hypothetical protein
LECDPTSADPLQPACPPNFHFDQLEPTKGDSLMKRAPVSFAYLPRVLSAVGLIALVVGSAAFPRHAVADVIYAYDNLSNSINGGDRINTTTRGRAQGFVATTSGSLATAVLGLYPTNATTGGLNYALYNLTGNGPYSIGSQVGSTGAFSTSVVTGSYTYLDVTSLGWEITSGNKYAVALWSELNNWNNPDGSGGGLAWNGGVSSANNVTVFNNWAVGLDPWEDWGNTTTGFSLALSTQAVPEPSTYAMALAGLACGGYSLFRRRSAR